MKTLLCAQGSSEWFAARCGVVTASEVDALITPLGKIKTGEGPKTYLYQKLSEKIYGFAQDSLSSWSMEQGTITEKIALPWLEFTYDIKVDRVGFCLSDDGRIGASPDGLIGSDCGVEVKSPQGPQQIRCLLNGVVPPEYIPQIQMSLYVTKRPRWMFVSYSRHLPSLVLTVLPDPAFQAALDSALKSFVADFDSAYNRVQQMMKGGAE